jgi:hypothetical protein
MYFSDDEVAIRSVFLFIVTAENAHALVDGVPGAGILQNTS